MNRIKIALVALAMGILMPASMLAPAQASTTTPSTTSATRTVSDGTYANCGFGKAKVKDSGIAVAASTRFPACNGTTKTVKPGQAIDNLGTIFVPAGQHASVVRGAYRWVAEEDGPVVIVLTKDAVYSVGVYAVPTATETAADVGPVEVTDGTPPETPVAGTLCMFNHGSQFFGAYTAWPLSRYNTTLMGGANKCGLAALIIGPDPGGWCFYDGPDTGSGHGTMGTWYLDANKTYYFGSSLSYPRDHYRNWHVIVVKRNGQGVCPTGRTF